MTQLHYKFNPDKIERRELTFKVLRYVFVDLP